MEIPTKKRMLVFSGSAYPALAEQVATHLGISLGKADLSRSASGELSCRFPNSVRGADAFVIQCHTDTQDSDLSINDYIFEQLIMIDALQRASAKRITAVVPFFGYARSEKKALPREPIGARLMSDLYIAAGADRILSVDLHTGQIQGFVNVPFDHLTAMPLFSEWVTEHVEDDRVAVAPDAGAMRLVEKFGRVIGAPLAIVHKRRDPREHNVSETVALIGDVESKVAILFDDMIDTGGTMCNAADILLEHGAERVIACTTHGVFSEPAISRLEKSNIDTVVVTDTLPIPAAKRFDRLVVLPVSPIIAAALQAIFEEQSVSELFRGENFF